MILTLLESLQSSSDGTLKEAARNLLQLSSEYLSRFELSIKDQNKIKEMELIKINDWELNPHNTKNQEG